LAYFGLIPDLFSTAVPAHNPYISGQKTRYSPGELVELNCTANSSDPVADLFWYINSESVSIFRFLYFSV
jgi:hypothetical protein